MRYCNLIKFAGIHEQAASVTTVIATWPGHFFKDLNWTTITGHCCRTWRERSKLNIPLHFRLGVETEVRTLSEKHRVIGDSQDDTRQAVFAQASSEPPSLAQEYVVEFSNDLLRVQDHAITASFALACASTHNMPNTGTAL